MFVRKSNLHFKMHSPGYFLHKYPEPEKPDVRGFSQMSFDVRGLSAEILEAGIIIELLQGPKLRVAYSFAGVGHFQKGWEH